MHNQPPRIALDEELLAKFQEENPNITVEYTVVPDQEWDTTLASGSGPDLFNQATFAIGQFYSQGILAPLDAEAAGYADQAAMYADYEAGVAPVDLCGNVWEWTESERGDGRTRFVILKGGSYYQAKDSEWYADGGAQANDFAAKFLLMYPGLDRCAADCG